MAWLSINLELALTWKPLNIQMKVPSSALRGVLQDVIEVFYGRAVQVFWVCVVKLVDEGGVQDVMGIDPGLFLGAIFFPVHLEVEE